MMEEELGKILENEELDNSAKQEAIKVLVGKSFVPNNQYNKAKEKQEEQIKAYDSLKAEYDTFKQSKMTDDEKTALQAKQKEDELKAIKTQLNEATAKSMFSEAGIDKEVYESLLPSVVKEDTELTKATVSALCKSLAKQKESIKKELEKKYIENTPTPPAGNDNNNGTADDVESYKKLYEEAVEKHDYQKMAYYTRLVQEAQMKKK